MPYPVVEALARGGAVGDPSAEIIAGMPTEPYSPDRMMAEVEEPMFSD